MYHFDPMNYLTRWVLTAMILVSASVLKAQHSDANIFGDVQSDGEHIPFATVHIEGTTIGTATDITGHYMLIDLPPGKHVLVAAYIGYTTVRKEITGPNQRWCWDISYLPTYEKGMFLYLYLLLDEFSRKAISWLIGWRQRAQEAQELLENGLLTENILALPEPQRPEIINDRGRQMKARSIKTVFELHGMPQLFARPRTPNDNPFVESAFGTAKTAPGYPGRFLDRQDAVRYFDKYFQWYNTEHLHSGIDYVTPEQCHDGFRDKIVAERKAKFDKQRNWRKQVNRRGRDPSPAPCRQEFATLLTPCPVA